MNIVEKWASCYHSLTFSYDNEDVIKELGDEGYNVNYCCEKKEVADSGQFQIVGLQESGSTNRVAILYGLGQVEDPKVIEALNGACGKCQFYKKNSNKM